MKVQVTREKIVEIIVIELVGLSSRYADIMNSAIRVGVNRTKISEELGLSKSVVSNYLTQLRSKQLIKGKVINPKLFENNLELYVKEEFKTNVKE